jgi:hypothetical protein
MNNIKLIDKFVKKLCYQNEKNKYMSFIKNVWNNKILGSYQEYWNAGLSGACKSGNIKIVQMIGIGDYDMRVKVVI